MDKPDSWNETAATAPGAGRRPADPVEHADEQTSAAALARVENLRVLVIDRNEVRLDALHRSMARLGLDAHVGDVGREGYRRAMALRPDVVLSDLATPGDPGWWLFHRFRRQPLLRWTPVLLMRWWEVLPDGRERILTSKVVERLGEALAPVRVLEERVTAGRFTGDRVELTGLPLLLRVIENSRLSGCFSVNDSWNIFECHFQNGRPLLAVRRGVDGSSDLGDSAMLQLVLCESGRWSFRSEQVSEAEKNLDGTLAECLDRAAATIAEFFGPDARMDQGSASLLDVRTSLVHEIAASLGGGGRQLLEALAAGASPAEVESLITGETDVVAAERAVLSLLRSGAVVPGTGSSGEGRDPEGHRVARAVAALSGIIGRDHRAPDQASKAGGGATPAARQETGYYRVSPMQAEKVAARAREGLIVPGARTSITDDLALGSRDGKVAPPPERPTPLVSLSPEAREVFQSDTGIAPRYSRPLVLPRESLVPPPEPEIEEEQGRSQMWLAILLAVLLGGLVLGGIWLVAGQSPRPPEPPAGSGAPAGP